MMGERMHRRAAAAIAASLCTCLLVACGSVQFSAGRPLDMNQFDTVLRAGVSTQADVVAVLGQPVGKGGGQLPFHDAPRQAWTYFWERGSMDMAGGLNDERLYCFVFFAGETLDSYMCFTSALQPAKR